MSLRYAYLKEWQKILIKSYLFLLMSFQNDVWFVYKLHVLRFKSSLKKLRIKLPKNFERKKLLVSDNIKKDNDFDLIRRKCQLNDLSLYWFQIPQILLNTLVMKNFTQYTNPVQFNPRATIDLNKKKRK